MEPDERTDDPQYNTCTLDRDPDASGAASSVSKTPVDFPDDSNKPHLSESVGDSSLHSRDFDHTYSQDQKNEQNNSEEEPKNHDENKDEGIMCGIIGKKNRGYYYSPILFYRRNIDKTYYHRYFKPYSYEHRMLKMDHECQCPRGKTHETNCSWYDPDIIHILEIKTDLSTSEKAAQQKIYQMHQNTLNIPPEHCGY